MVISDEDREWIDTRADQLFRESERRRGGIRPNTVMPQDYRDYFVVQAAWERSAERMRERAAVKSKELWADYEAEASPDYIANGIRALPLSEETTDADA